MTDKLFYDLNNKTIHRIMNIYEHYHLDVINSDIAMKKIDQVIREHFNKENDIITTHYYTNSEG